VNEVWLYQRTLWLKNDYKDTAFCKFSKGEKGMKLHFTLNLPDMDQALTIAKQTAEYADILGVGSLLLYKEGIKAIQTFRATFPNKEIFAEARISERAEDAVSMMATAGANHISVLACAPQSTIKKAVEKAKDFDVKIALDLLGAPSLGQIAMDAKTLGITTLIVHRPLTKQGDMAELDAEWHNVKENTKLPIFITGKIDESTIQHILSLKPSGIMIGTAITKADNPAKAAYFFKSLI
jgi:3-keto-L-gulonate-6-phosphate decarboxylase